MLTSLLKRGYCWNPEEASLRMVSTQASSTAPARPSLGPTVGFLLALVTINVFGGGGFAGGGTLFGVFGVGRQSFMAAAHVWKVCQICSKPKLLVSLDSRIVSACNLAFSLPKGLKWLRVDPKLKDLKVVISMFGFRV